MKPIIDFQFYEVLPASRVTGRNCGVDAPLRTVFTALYRRNFPSRLPSEGIISPEPEFVRKLSLRLDGIEIYRRQMEFVPEGWTAMLTLSGADLDAVSKLLSAALDHTYYSLCSDDASA